MPQLTLNPIGSYWLTAFVAAVLVALLWVRPRHVKLSAWQFATLAGLRLAVVLLTLVAMLRPTLVYKILKPQPAALMLLLDTSRSMQVEDSLGGAARWQAARKLLVDSKDALTSLAENLDLQVLSFAGDVRPLPLVDGVPDLPTSADGDQTALGSALVDLLESETAARVLGVLVLSDGAQRAIPPRDTAPQIAAGRLAAENVPLYTFTFGQAGGSGRADLAIDDLTVGDTIFAQAPVDVHASFTAAGFANQTIRIQLLWEDADGKMQVVAAKQITTGLAGEPIPVTLRHTPPEPGERKISMVVEAREGELVTSNNVASTFVTVREGGINVRYLAGATRTRGGPGIEQRFIRNALAASPDVVVERRLIDYQRPVDDLGEVLIPGELDVVLLDNVDRSGLTETSWQDLTDFVARGGGLIVIGGYHSFGPGGYRALPIADVLPINIGFAERQNFGETLRDDVHITTPVSMRPATPWGLRHPIMQLGESSGDIWSQLPPLDGANLFPRRSLKPNAQVLAESDDAGAHPLLVAGEPGSGRAIAFAGDSTWRWPLFGFDEAHRRFWRQCILWLAKKDQADAGDVWIRLAARRVRRGGRVDFQFGATSAELAPVKSATYEVQIEAPDGTLHEVRPARRADEWTASFRDTAQPGDYTVRVAARDTGKELGDAQARFLVPQRDVELDQPAADPGLMAALAQATSAAGGKSLAPEQLPSLLAELAEHPPQVKEEVLDRVTYWDTWPFLLIFVALLAVEWYLRKRWGLV